MLKKIKENTNLSDNERKYDLEERLLEFSIKIIDIVEELPNTKAGSHIAGQLIRCGTSPTFNYGEAESAESKNDFIHKNEHMPERITRNQNVLNHYKKETINRRYNFS